MFIQKFVFAVAVLFTACNCGVQDEYIVEEFQVQPCVNDCRYSETGEAVAEDVTNNVQPDFQPSEKPKSVADDATDTVKPWHTDCCVESYHAAADVSVYTFEYTGDISNAIIGCTNVLYREQNGEHLNRSTYMADAGGTQIAQLGLPAGTLWCQITGTINGNRVQIFQPGPPTGAWQYREGSSLTINGIEFAHEGCYIGIASVQNEVTVGASGDITVANESQQWDVCRD